MEVVLSLCSLVFPVQLDERKLTLRTGLSLDILDFVGLYFGIGFNFFGLLDFGGFFFGIGFS